MSIDKNRLIMELDEYRRTVNREQINPTLTKVNIESLSPVVNICAKARAKYIECLMTIAQEENAEGCNPEQIEKLRLHRVAYEELVAAANALETVIKRGYVDVK